MSTLSPVSCICNAISCHSATVCALAGSSFGPKPGEIATSTDPTGDTLTVDGHSVGTAIGRHLVARGHRPSVSRSETRA